MGVPEAPCKLWSILVVLLKSVVEEVQIEAVYLNKFLPCAGRNVLMNWVKKLAC